MSVFKRRSDRVPTITTLVVGAAALWGCASPAAPVPIQSPSATQTAIDSPVTLRGWLSIVWNDEPHFFLTLDDGQVVEILFEEALFQPLGGPLALDRTRVAIQAELMPNSSDLYQAVSVDLEGER